MNTSEGSLKHGYPWLADVRLYENMGWVEINIDVDNYSAYNDSFIEIVCNDGILVDDVKVTTSMDKFVAPPVITGISDVTETSFTVNFEPVRTAYNTYVYLLERIGYD